MQATDKANEMVGLIKSESERLMEYFESLSPETLEKPSPCEKWTVGEVIAHLNWFAEYHGGMIERGLGGDLSSTEILLPFPPETPNRQVIVDEFCSQAAIDRRRSLGQNLVPAFHDRYDWLNNLLARIGPGDWETPCYHALGQRSVGSFIPAILSELALHEWDVRSTLEPSTSISENLIPVLLEKLPTKVGRPWSISFPNMSNSPVPIRYRFELTSAGSGNLDVVVEGAKARLEPAAKTPANVSASCDASTFGLLMYGRLCLDSAIAAGRLTAEGDQGSMSDFDDWLAGN